MKCLQQCKQYRLFVLCTFLMIMTLMTLPRSVSAGGRRSKQSRHSLDRRNGRERLPIQPDDPSGSSRGRGRGSRKKASGKFIIKKSHTNKDMKIFIFSSIIPSSFPCFCSGGQVIFNKILILERVEYLNTKTSQRERN